MKIELTKVVEVEVSALEVEAEVRYWEDALIDGVEDTEGKIPLRDGDCWRPIINLATGFIKDWPQGITANVHYKVCDQGQYWLLDAEGRRVAKWKGYYVPDSLLCPNGDGYGDYIILRIEQDGHINSWRSAIDSDEWEAV
jgi:hypothetical protein